LYVAVFEGTPNVQESVWNDWGSPFRKLVYAEAPGLTRDRVIHAPHQAALNEKIDFSHPVHEVGVVFILADSWVDTEFQANVGALTLRN
jgi:hypothetical protein